MRWEKKRVFVARKTAKNRMFPRSIKYIVRDRVAYSIVAGGGKKCVYNHSVTNPNVSKSDVSSCTFMCTETLACYIRKLALTIHYIHYCRDEKMKCFLNVIFIDKKIYKNTPIHVHFIRLQTYDKKQTHSNHHKILNVPLHYNIFIF